MGSEWVDRWKYLTDRPSSSPKRWEKPRWTTGGVRKTRVFRAGRYKIPSCYSLWLEGNDVEMGVYIIYIYIQYVCIFFSKYIHAYVYLLYIDL